MAPPIVVVVPYDVAGDVAEPPRRRRRKKKEDDNFWFWFSIPFFAFPRSGSEKPKDEGNEGESQHAHDQPDVHLPGDVHAPGKSASGSVENPFPTIDPNDPHSKQPSIPFPGVPSPGAPAPGPGVPVPAPEVPIVIPLIQGPYFGSVEEDEEGDG